MSPVKSRLFYARGFNHTERLFEGEVKSEVIEKGMRRVAPELYET